MAEVSEIDIGGSRWTIKDKEARTSIEAIIAQFTPKEIGDIPITVKSGYSASSATIQNVIQYGKLYTGLVSISNVSGNNIGSTQSAFFGRVNIKPISYASAVGIEYKLGKPVRVTVREDGSFIISESTGIANGNNGIFTQLTWIEE